MKPETALKLIDTYAKKIPQGCVSTGQDALPFVEHAQETVSKIAEAAEAAGCLAVAPNPNANQFAGISKLQTDAAILRAQELLEDVALRLDLLTEHLIDSRLNGFHYLRPLSEKIDWAIEHVFQNGVYATIEEVK